MESINECRIHMWDNPVCRGYIRFQDSLERLENLTAYIDGSALYRSPEMLLIRHYLQEKIEMGMLQRVYLLPKKENQPEMGWPDVIHVVLEDVYINLWDRVIFPGLDAYACIITEEKAQHTTDANKMDVRFEVRLRDDDT